MSNFEEITLHDVFRWLAQRLGQPVNVSVSFDQGDYHVSLLEVRGELSRPTYEGLTSVGRESGAFTVGEATFDIGDPSLPRDFRLRRFGLGSALVEELMIGFSDDVRLHLVDTDATLPAEGGA